MQTPWCFLVLYTTFFSFAHKLSFNVKSEYGKSSDATFGFSPNAESIRNRCVCRKPICLGNSLSIQFHEHIRPNLYVWKMSIWCSLQDWAGPITNKLPITYPIKVWTTRSWSLKLIWWSTIRIWSYGTECCCQGQILVYVFEFKGVHINSNRAKFNTMSLMNNIHGWYDWWLLADEW